MIKKYGASQAAWRFFSEVPGLLPDLLPVVADPTATISPDSKMRGLGKTPSQINFRGHAAGFAKWTQHKASEADVRRWALKPEHGICIQTGRGRWCALDIDVADKAKASKIVCAVQNLFPFYYFPERSREGTGKTLLVFAFAGELPKHVIPVEGGMIEVLGTGQQFIAESGYIDAKTGVAIGRYLWPKGWPVDPPLLTADDFAMLLGELVITFASGDVKIARSKRAFAEEAVTAFPGVDDPVANWLAENWDVYDQDRDGRLFIRCPFEDDHTSDSGPTATAYFPAGTGGYEQGHFDCKHAHCLQRSDGEFREATGYEADQFPDLAGAPSGIDKGIAPGWPKFVRNKSTGLIKGSATNLSKALGCKGMTDMDLAFDEFTAGVVWAPPSEEPPQWRAFDDEHYVDARIALELRGFDDFGDGRFRAGIYHVAKRQAIDTAVEWLDRLVWDGTPRVESFITETCPGVEDRPYIQALSRYIWTALAGRVLKPGVKADMVPVLTGGEGKRKSSWVAALSPNADAFAEVSLKHRDDDTSRKMRGKLVVELAELQGINSRDGEDIKAFIVRQVEEWTPKYMEFTKRFARRCLLFGTTNMEEFLSVKAGFRRWLPFHVSETMDIDKLIAMRDQLWAEGAVMFKQSGVDWSVEHLASDEREEFLETDGWQGPIIRWLLTRDAITKKTPVENPYGWNTTDVLVGVLGYRNNDVKRGDQMRVGDVLNGLGARKKKTRGKGWVYKIEKEQLDFFDLDEGSAL